MKIALLGYGKMGKTIEGIALEKGHEVVLKVNINNLEDLTAENLRKADVAIEFSRPETAFDNIKLCLENDVPVVSGTTAWLEQYDDAVAFCKAQNGAFLYASNFSIGVNIFFEINRQLAALMDEHNVYKANVEEIHHTQKLDAPSGTAITIAQGMLEKISRYKDWSLEEDGKAIEAEKIPIVAKRIDPAPGTHTVSYDSAIDTIEIKHTAHSRLGFASGALTAAEWIVGKNGVFSMKDVLGI